MFRLTQVARPLRRNLSTKAATPAAVKPTLRLYGKSAPYAQALFECVDEDKGNYNKISADLKDWQAQLKADDRLRLFVEDNGVKQEVRDEAMGAIYKETKYDELSQDIINTMIAKRATGHLRELITSFDALCAFHYNVRNAVITTAEPLTAKQAKSVKAKLTAMSKGATMTIEEKVDPSILGGMILEMGNTVQDLSVRNAIGSCERTLRSAVA